MTNEIDINRDYEIHYNKDRHFEYRKNNLDKTIEDHIE